MEGALKCALKARSECRAITGFQEIRGHRSGTWFRDSWALPGGRTAELEEKAQTKFWKKARTQWYNSWEDMVC